MKEWKQERCAQRPEELQRISKETYIQRRNIREATHEADEDAGTEAYTEWVCESREIGISEYEMLKSVEEINTQKAIDDYTEMLIEEGIL